MLSNEAKAQKDSMTDALRRIAVDAVKSEGYEVEYRPGRGELLTLRKGGKEFVTSLKVTVSSRVGAALNEHNEWRVLPSTDMVLIASADGEDGALDYTVETASVWLVATDEFINRLEMLRKDKVARGYDPQKQGFFLSLKRIPAPHRQSPGSGLGEDIKPIAHNVHIGLPKIENPVIGTEKVAVIGAKQVVPLTVEEAKVAVAAKLGVTPNKVRIVVEF